jgi:hypothetical protein
MLLAIPASVVANIARVLSIILWRQTFYPAVESPQMHYFIGFLWLLPLLALFVPRGQRTFISYAVETSMLAAALSLVAPQAAAPGGVWVTVCALLLLAGQDWQHLKQRRDQIFVLAWIAAAIFITGAAMESLWLPWLLLCPWCFPRRWALTPAILLLPGTVPVLAMKLPWLTLPGIATAVWLLLRANPNPTATGKSTRSQAHHWPWPACPASRPLHRLNTRPSTPKQGRASRRNHGANTRTRQFPRPLPRPASGTHRHLERT